jgi:hypothetical protein
VSDGLGTESERDIDGEDGGAEEEQGSEHEEGTHDHKRRWNEEEGLGRDRLWRVGRVVVYRMRGG